jgi:hypothetical protein
VLLGTIKKSLQDALAQPALQQHYIEAVIKLIDKELTKFKK